MTQITYSKEELILSVDNVSVKFGDKQVLKNIHFNVNNITRPDMVQGQIISLCGRSGIGKSTLFKVLSGFLKPTTGTVKFGENQKDVEKGEVGVVPQNYPLFQHRTIYENLAIAMGKRTDKKAVIEQYAAHFEIDAHLEKYPCDLSGGQRQRVSILQQLMAGNTFILLDEPFSGLDTLMKDKVVQLLIDVANLSEHNTLVVVSHDIESACAISDTVHVLANPDGDGAMVVKSYDLLAEGLAYTQDIKYDKRFIEIIDEIKTLL
jgi:ABC-type nitrate/sulfonate/bicarbonate transport system ATPase subunit